LKQDKIAFCKKQKRHKIAKRPRESDTEIIGDLGWGTHLCQFYRTKEDLMEILIPYFEEGLENNELCIWAVPESFEAKERAMEKLRKVIPQLDIYLEKGQIEIISFTDLYITERINEGVFDS